MKKNSLKYYLDFFWAMTEKEIKARYKRTVFGFLWLLMNPIFQMTVIGFVFSFFVRIPVENYYLFLFSGLLPWQFFSLSWYKATRSFVDERQLLQKADFPRQVLPISIVLANFFHFVVAMCLLLLFLLITNQLFIGHIFLLFLASLLLLLFTVGLSLLTSTLHVKFRDIGFFVQALLVLWFYASPIVYDLSLIPEKFRYLYLLNPLTYIFELFHTSVSSSSLPPNSIIVSNIIISLLVISLGVFVFKRENKYFVDRL